MAAANASALYNNHLNIDEYDYMKRSSRDETFAKYDCHPQIDKNDFDWSNNCNTNNVNGSSTYRSNIPQQNNVTKTLSNSQIDHHHQVIGYPNHQLKDLSATANTLGDSLNNKCENFHSADKLEECNNNDLYFLDSNNNTRTDNQNFDELLKNEIRTDQFYDDMNILNANNIDKTLKCNFIGNDTQSSEIASCNINQEDTPLISSQTISLITVGIDNFHDIVDAFPYDQGESQQNGTNHGEVTDAFLSNYQIPSNEYKPSNTNFPNNVSKDQIYEYMNYDSLNYNGQSHNDNCNDTPSSHGLPTSDSTQNQHLTVEINAQNENTSSENSKNKNILPEGYPKIFESIPDEDVSKVATNINSIKAQLETENLQFFPEVFKEEKFLSLLRIEREKLEAWADGHNPFLKHDLKFLETEYWFHELNRDLMQHHLVNSRTADLSLDVLLDKDISSLNIQRSPYVLRSLMKVANDDEGIPSKAKKLFSKLQEICTKSGKGTLTDTIVSRSITKQKKENNQMTFEWMFLRDTRKLKKQTSIKKGNSGVIVKKSNKKISNPTFSHNQDSINSHDSSDTSQQLSRPQGNGQIDTSSVENVPPIINIDGPELFGTRLEPQKDIEEPMQEDSSSNIEQFNVASNESTNSNVQQIPSPSSSPRLVIYDPEE